MKIVISAVGGQGALLASRVLGKLALILGKDVKLSEVHGMAQRGGSVITYVSLGNKVNSPLIEKGTADYVLALELLEGVRNVSYLKNGGTLIINKQKIDPMPVVIGLEEVPENLLDTIISSNINIVSVDALDMARKAGNVKTVNTVLIGVLARKMDFKKEAWIKAIEDTVPQKYFNENIKAFNLGYEKSMEEREV